jgi:uncharacterized protein with NAD-binding domain and iron-sulfur cluster
MIDAPLPLAPTPTDSQQKIRVIVLGGGCGGIACAYWLTSTSALRESFDVTIFTRGWRLGGKGASGRAADASNRIEEHGLHMWLVPGIKVDRYVAL